MGGMRLPGLRSWASEIQALRLVGVLGTVLAPMVSLVPKWVRSGPFVPEADVPRMVWQPAQGWLVNTCSPSEARGSVGLGAGWALSAAHVAKSAGVCTTTTKFMLACCTPQYCRHSPR